MKTTLKHLGSIIVCASLLIAAPVLAGKGNAGNPGIAPPNSTPYGMSYGEWVAAWWQWAFRTPAENSPLYDEIGTKAGVDQSGPVWFLAGVFNESGQAHRTIQVPSGKALFFPVLNTECSNLSLEEGTEWYRENPDDLLGCAASYADDMTGSAIIDGVEVKNLDRYMFASPVFPVDLPANNIFGGEEPESGMSAAVGYHLMIRPLPVGSHIIEFRGSIGGFELHIIYDIEVVPAGRYNK